MTRPAPVAWMRSHPVAADALLAGLLTALQVGAELTATSDRRGKDPDVLSVLLVIAASAPVAWRRRWPVQALGVSAGFAALYEVVGYHGAGGGLAVLVGVYSAAAHGDRRESRTGAVIAAAAIAVVMAANLDHLTAVDVISNYLVFATAWILGDNLRGRRAHVAGLEERAAAAEHRRLAEAQRAVEAERVRLAREMHDIVAHGMSVMVVQAAAARRVLEQSPDQAREALASIEATGRQALDEMRRMLGVLRGAGGGREDAALMPQPSALDIGELVDQFRDTGLPVTLRVTGSERAVPAGVGLALYRVVQEALTNTLKHAGPSTAAVTVQFDPEQLSIEVVDDGRGSAVPESARGHGLMGMRERIDLYGGELRAGPRPGGGWRVWAQLPL